jgi:predicted ATP-grasp superfamily ATP-dependent carboligase
VPGVVCLIGKRILVTDAQERAVLASLRCLRTAGFDVTAVGTSRTAPGLWSRAPRRRHVAPDPRVSVDGFIDRIEELVRERTHDALIAGMDASLMAISRHRARLEPYVRLGLPPDEVVQRALDRESVEEAASKAGLAPPESRVCEEPREALSAAESFGYPVMVKPRRTVVENGGGAKRRASAVACDARAVQAAARAFGRCIVQRRVGGNVMSFGGVCTDRGLLAFVVSRYGRTWPAEGGNVSFSETISAPDGLADRVQELVSRLGWVGLFELELIERAGCLAAIDFNPRAYGSLSLATASGVPLPVLWCQWLLGAEPRPAVARAGERYRWEDADLRHLVWRLRHGDVQSALSVATPHRNVTHAYFQLDDPVPTVARALQVVSIARERSKERG